MRLLTIEPSEQYVHITRLTCDDEKVDALIHRIELALLNAQELIGEGEAEVPSDLRALLRFKEKEYEQ